MVSAGFTQFAQGHDGYTYYQEISFFPLESVDESKGLLTLIPKEGYSGWICSWTVDDSYECRSKFLPIAKYHQSEPVDLGGNNYDSLGWFCDVTPGQDDLEGRDVVKCFNFMPVEADVYEEGSYRWSPNTTDLVQQVGYVQDPLG